MHSASRPTQAHGAQPIFALNHKQTLSELPEADLTIKKRPAAEDATAAEACGNKASEDDGGGTGSTEHDYAYNLAPPVGQWVDLKNGIR